MRNKALMDRIRIQISYPNGQRIGFSFVTLTIQIDVPKLEQIRIIARPIRSDANTYPVVWGRGRAAILFPPQVQQSAWPFRFVFLAKDWLTVCEINVG